MGPESEKKLGIDKPEYKPYLINSFWGMGWSDPFPDEHSSIEPELADMIMEGKLIYNESRYEYDRSIVIIYLPSKLVMLKMMRACIGVDRKEMLWVYEYPAVPNE